MNLMPFSVSLRGSFGFSDAWPQPDNHRVDALALAMLVMRSTLA